MQMPLLCYLEENYRYLSESYRYLRDSGACWAAMGPHRVRHDWSDLAAATAASSLLRPGLLLEPWRFQGNVRKFWNPTWFLSPKEKVVECRHASTEGALDASVPSKGTGPDKGNGWPMPSQLCDSKVSACLCVCVRAKLLQSCLTLCDPMDCSPPVSSVHGILQARILGWVAKSSSRDLPNPGIKPETPVFPALQADSLPLSHLEKLANSVSHPQSPHCQPYLGLQTVWQFT